MRLPRGHRSSPSGVVRDVLVSEDSARNSSDWASAPTSETALAGATIFVNFAAFTGAVNGYPKVPLWCQNPFGLHVP